jgi:SulP family sulfate permease
MKKNESRFIFGNLKNSKNQLNFKKNDRGLIKNYKNFACEIKDNWLEVLKSKTLLQDSMAALTVVSVAIPLNIALAVSCGLSASAGLLAGAIGGGLAAIFGGSALQVTGPAAALNVMVLAITAKFGTSGVLIACLIIGLIQFILCSFSTGRFIKYVPEAVLAGFTTGVGITLLNIQIPKLLGFEYNLMHLIGMLNFQWLLEVSWFAVICGISVAFIVTSCRQFKRFPASFVGIIIVTTLSMHLNWNIERVGNIPSFISTPNFPLISSDKLFSLIIACIPLALLASIESLLSAQAVDKISHAPKPHNPNLELFGQSLGNIGSGLFGGMPVSGVIVRSTVNVQSGAKTRLSSLLHAILIVVFILYFSEIMAAIPIAALAGLLCVVGVRLVEGKVFVHLLKTNKFHSLAFLFSMLGTISDHLFIGLSIGLLIFFLEKWVNNNQKNTDNKNLESNNNQRRAVIPAKNKIKTLQKPKHHYLDTKNTNWLSQIREKAYIAASSYVHQRASLIGKVILGEHVHIAAETSIRADEGTPFYIGSNSNIQDGVVIHALKEKWVNIGGEDWAVYIGENVSVAHQALVHGPCYIGDKSFIGFQAIVHDSIIGSHCYIGIGAIVIGVEIPEGRYVPHGMVVDSLDKVELLPKVTDAHLNFNEDVVDVNKGLVYAYKKHNNQNINTDEFDKKISQVLNWRTASDKF